VLYLQEGKTQVFPLIFTKTPFLSQKMIISKKKSGDFW